MKNHKQIKKKSKVEEMVKMKIRGKKINKQASNKHNSSSLN